MPFELALDFEQLFKSGGRRGKAGQACSTRGKRRFKVLDHIGGGAEGQGYIRHSGWRERSEQMEMGPVSFDKHAALGAEGSQ